MARIRFRTRSGIAALCLGICFQGLVADAAPEIIAPTATQNSPDSTSKPSSEIKIVRSVYDLRDLIAAKDCHTTVPKGGVLFCPETLKESVPAKAPKTKYVDWWEFYRLNGRWILTEKITLEQAAGKVPLEKSRCEAILKSNRLVVAVYGTNPVSYYGEKILSPEQVAAQKKKPVKATNSTQTVPEIPKTEAPQKPMGFPGKNL